MRPSPRSRGGGAPEAADGGAPERVRGRADGARPRAAGGAHGARRRRRRQGRRSGVGEVEERRERGGKRAQGRAVVINSGYFKKSKTSIRTAVSAVFKHVRTPIIMMPITPLIAHTRHAHQPSPTPWPSPLPISVRVSLERPEAGAPSRRHRRAPPVRPPGYQRAPGPLRRQLQDAGADGAGVPSLVAGGGRPAYRLRALAGHTGGVMGSGVMALVSLPGGLVASGSKDRTVRV